MADISVHIFVQNLKELMKSQHPNITGEKDQLESLYNDIFCMSSFLKKIDENYLPNSDAGSSEDQLGKELLKRLKDKKYLIVLDDIWIIEAWNGIRRSFPANHNGSRVIYTSQFAAIGKDVCRDINTHILSGLSEEHSWNLLKNKVFGGRDFPQELEEFGREIFKKCDGLSLAIIVIGGILANKEKTTKLWEQVARCLAPAIATDREAYMDTIAPSYQHFPVHLKACFLYLGSIFPEYYEIPVRRLV